MTIHAHRKSASLASRLLVSAALVVLSGAYGYWQSRLQPNGARRRPHLITLKAVPPTAHITPKAAAQQVALATPLPALAMPRPTAVSPPPLSRAPARAKKKPALAAKGDVTIAPTESNPPADSAGTPALAIADAHADAPPIAPHRMYAFSDGDYTGAPAECEWGTVQVEVSIHGGAITDVRFLQMPDHRERSAEISDWASPVLASETIKEQNYDVDIVSSATFTSQAFQQTLSSALEQARKS